MHILTFEMEGMEWKMKQKARTTSKNFLFGVGIIWQSLKIKLNLVTPPFKYI